MIGWTTAFLDSPASSFAARTSFWAAVSGSTLSPSRGEAREFATLVPPSGDAHLRVQRVGGSAGVHLDLHVPSLTDGVEAAVALGARLLSSSEGVRVLASPGGFVWCLVGVGESVRTPPVAWGGHRSLVDQICLDVPAEAYDAEETFWATLTGWSLQETADDHGLRAIDRPPGLPLRILLQRLDESGGPVRAHLDLATDDREAEVARHLALGAEVVRRTPWWTTLLDPAGEPYCVTDRDPDTGLLG